jgi:hypothetical protein
MCHNLLLFYSLKMYNLSHLETFLDI